MTLFDTFSIFASKSRLLFQKSLHAPGMVKKLLLLLRFFMLLSLGLYSKRAVPVKFDLHLNLSWNAEIGPFRHPPFRAPWQKFGL